MDYLLYLLTNPRQATNINNLNNLSPLLFVIFGLLILVNCGISMFLFYQYTHWNPGDKTTRPIKTFQGGIGIYILAIINIFGWLIIPIGILLKLYVKYY